MFGGNELRPSSLRDSIDGSKRGEASMGVAGWPLSCQLPFQDKLTKSKAVQKINTSKKLLVYEKNLIRSYSRLDIHCSAELLQKRAWPAFGYGEPRSDCDGLGAESKGGRGFLICFINFRTIMFPLSGTQVSFIANRIESEWDGSLNGLGLSFSTSSFLYPSPV